MTNPFFLPNRVEKKPKFPLILFLYKYQSLIVSISWKLDRVFKIKLGASVLNKIVKSRWKFSKTDISKISKSWSRHCQGDV